MGLPERAREAADEERSDDTGSGWKHALLGVAAVRTICALVAIPLAPFLYEKHFLILVFLRPSALVLLAGGYLARHGMASLWIVVAAAIPMQILAVWVYYGLGRAWSKELDGDDELPFFASRLLRRDQVRSLREEMRDSGPWLAAATRFAAFPSGLTAAAVGSSGLKPKAYLLADALAILVASGIAIGIGYGLGVAYEQAGPWVVAVGIIGLAAITVAWTLVLRRRVRAHERDEDDE